MVNRFSVIFLQRSKGQFSAWNLFELASYSKFGFFRPDLDGNKLAKGMCLARKARDREAFNLIVPRVVNYSVFFLESLNLSRRRKG